MDESSGRPVRCIAQPVGRPGGYTQLSPTSVCRLSGGRRLISVREEGCMVNRAEGVPANEERGLVCDVRMGQSQARRAERGIASMKL